MINKKKQVLRESEKEIIIEKKRDNIKYNEII